MVRVKICGITNVYDAVYAAQAGADAIGLVFAPSKRQVTVYTARLIVRELPPFIKTVGVFVNESLTNIQKIQDEAKIDLIQLSGDESEDYSAFFGTEAIKAIHVRDNNPPIATDYRYNYILLDTAHGSEKGGTGKVFDWRLAVEIARVRPIILAGGLNPENVVEAINTVRPYAVDVSSGVEKEPGRKDNVKVRAFINRAKSVEYSA